MSGLVFGGTKNGNRKMKGGSFAEVGAGASGQLTAGNGMGVTGAGEIATGGKLGPIAAHASVDGMTIAHEGMHHEGMKGGRRHRKRKSAKRSSAKRSGSKRKSVKRRSSKRKSTKNKRRSSKRKSRKH